VSTTDSPSADRLFTGDAWAWWQSRRLRYNLALAATGWVAYGLTVALRYGFRAPMWPDWRGALSMTLFLGIAFLVLMGAANVFYLLGPTIESLVKPADAGRFRATAYRMGFWGSLALPFVFPTVNLAALIASR
jgi:hypothetical protein